MAEETQNSAQTTVESNQHEKPLSSLAGKMSDVALIQAMEDVQEICATVHAVRTKHNLRNRQPLESFDLIDPNGKYSYLAFCPDLASTVKDECNVKNIVVKTNDYSFTV